MLLVDELDFSSAEFSRDAAEFSVSAENRSEIWRWKNKKENITGKT